MAAIESSSSSLDAHLGELSYIIFFAQSNEHVSLFDWIGRERADFQNFLKQYPDTEYSDNAQFWIGECYYFEKNYEKAILEYDKVAKNYPDGDRVPYALLKQGLSFLNLGDKTGARLLLQQVIKDYPNTNQAKIARAKLLESQ